jgi:hypothetical protein
MIIDNYTEARYILDTQITLLLPATHDVSFKLMVIRQAKQTNNNCVTTRKYTTARANA